MAVPLVHQLHDEGSRKGRNCLGYRPWEQASENKRTRIRIRSVGPDDQVVDQNARR